MKHGRNMSSDNSFIPLKRRKFSIKDCYSNDAKAWTASQCHRLLRPISSRIEILKKDSIRFASARTPPASSQLPAVPIIPTVAPAGCTKDVGDRDPDWCGRKRVRRTYSGRSKVKQEYGSNLTSSRERPQKPLVPGEISIPTPILNRTKDTNDLESFCHRLSEVTGKVKRSRRPQARYVTKDGEAHFRLSENMRQIKSTIDPLRYSLYEGIYNALDALLKATKSAPSEQCILQSRTLLSQCLRRVPFYIKEEADWILCQAKESGMNPSIEARDASAETYSSLESFGSSVGWKHLKTVVRAHGIALVSDAIVGGLVDSRFASALVTLCVHTSFYDEGELLLEALLTSLQYPDPLSTESRLCDDSAMLPLSTLNSFVKYTSRIGYHHRTLATLFSTGSLPIMWLATKDFTWVWNDVFLSLSSDPPDHNASTFISTVLPIIYTTRQASIVRADMLSVLDATFTSVVATLSAMINLGGNIIHLLRSIIIDCGLFSLILGNKEAKVIAVANLLAGIEDDSTSLKKDTDFLKLLVYVLRRKHCRPSKMIECVDGNVIAFICSVARCCGRGSSSDGFKHLKAMLERLDCLAIDLLGKDMLPHIIVDSAFAFAHQIPNQEHLEYAEEISVKYRGFRIQRKSSQSSLQGDLHVGFRWEEGISEWVTTTPATTMKRRDDVGLLALGDESDDGTPIRPSFKHHKLTLSPQLIAKDSEYARLTYSRVSNLVPPTPRMGHESSKPLLDVPPLTDPPIVAYISSTRPRRSFSKTHEGGRELLWTKKDWKFFDESEDELGSSTLIPSDVGSVLSELPDRLNFGCRKRLRATKATNRSLGEYSVVTTDSEDELGL
jgi:hypothetical protein